MLIDFNTVSEQALEHFKGGESMFYAKIADMPAVRILKGRLIPGASIGLHCHEQDSEIIYIESGSGYVLYEGEHITLKSGNSHYCPTGCSHSLINDGDSDLVFFAVIPKA